MIALGAAAVAADQVDGDPDLVVVTKERR